MTDELHELGKAVKECVTQLREKVQQQKEQIKLLEKKQKINLQKIQYLMKIKEPDLIDSVTGVNYSTLTEQEFEAYFNDDDLDQQMWDEGTTK